VVRGPRVRARSLIALFSGAQITTKQLNGLGSKVDHMGSRVLRQSTINRANLRTSGDETALERRDYLCRFGGALPRASRMCHEMARMTVSPFKEAGWSLLRGGLTWRGSKRKRQSLLSQKCPLASHFPRARWVAAP
jgi:hypothetical protein